MHPETKKLKQRIQDYKTANPQFAGPGEPIYRRKHHKKHFTGNEHCYYCGKKLTRYSATWDHVQPLSRGGEDTRKNLVWCCIQCNKAKGSLTIEEWKEQND